MWEALGDRRPSNPKVSQGSSLWGPCSPPALDRRALPERKPPDALAVVMPGEAAGHVGGKLVVHGEPLRGDQIRPRASLLADRVGVAIVLLHHSERDDALTDVIQQRNGHGLAESLKGGLV